jgi:hypothetical protein
MTTTPLRTHLRAADLILIAAEGSNFPLPRSVVASDFSLRIQFEGGMPVEWVEWAGSPEVKVERASNGAAHIAKGTLFDHPVELTAWVKA